MIELTKQCEEPTELLECKTYPAIIDLLMNNLKGSPLLPKLLHIQTKSLICPLPLLTE